MIFTSSLQGPATPSFSGDWRGGAAGHQAPQVGAPRAARPAPVVENDSEEEASAHAQGTQAAPAKGESPKKETVDIYNIYIYYIYIYIFIFIKYIVYNCV